jgi:hypothetical protein
MDALPSRDAALLIMTFLNQLDKTSTGCPFALVTNRHFLMTFSVCYHELIAPSYMEDETEKVGYLTVHESYMDVGEAQRREGLHIQSPGVFTSDPNDASIRDSTPYTLLIID